MSRPVRMKFPGVLYHVTAHGNGRKNIYRNDHDNRDFPELFEHASLRYDWVYHGCCSMDNHNHFLIATPDDKTRSANDCDNCN